MNRAGSFMGFKGPRNSALPRAHLSSSATKAGNAQDHFQSLVINQETDIVLIIGGLQNLVNACLGIKIDKKDIKQV